MAAPTLPRQTATTKPFEFACKAAGVLRDRRIFKTHNLRSLPVCRIAQSHNSGDIADRFGNGHLHRHFQRTRSGVDATDFQASGLASSTVSSVVAVDTAIYSVIVTGVIGNGQLSVKLVDDGSIRDTDNRQLVSHAASFVNQSTYSQEAGVQTPLRPPI